MAAPAAALTTDVLGFELEAPLPVALTDASEAAEAAWAALADASGGAEAASLRAPDARTRAELAACGVGAPHRRALWLAWSGGGGGEAGAAARRAAYEALLAEADAASAADDASPLSAALAQIALDVERTFPEHALFRPGGAALPPLRRVLACLAAARPALGYVQGMNFCAGFCLLALCGGDAAAFETRAALEADALCVLRALLHERLPGYYGRGLAHLRSDLSAVSSGLRARAPAAAARLDALGLDLTALLPRWLLCLFVGAVPTAAALRGWDALLAAPAGEARRGMRRMAAALLLTCAPALAASEEAGEAAAALRGAGAAVVDPCVLQRAALAPSSDAAAAAPEDATPPPPSPAGPRRVPLARRNAGTPAATPVARKRSAAAAGVGGVDVAALLTPFGAAMQSLNADWERMIQQSPVPGLVASALGALSHHKAAFAPPGATPRAGQPPSRSGAAKRPRADGASPLPAWLQATPVRSAAAAAAAAAEDGDGAEMELMALRPRRLATTPVRDMR